LADLGRSRIPIVDGAREEGKFINISSSSNGDKTGLVVVDILCSLLTSVVSDLGENQAK